MRRAPAMILAAAACCLAALAWLQFTPLPEPLRHAHLPALTTVLLDKHGTLLCELPGPDARSHRPIPLRDMGPWMPALTVAREDHRFFSHHGIDMRSTARAALRGRGGASTLSQQVVKLATGRQRASYTTKLHEALVALQLEWRWGKPRILEEYLNRAPYGNRLIGIEAASLAYFQKPARNLTKDESLYLAGLPQAPSRLNPWTRPDAARAQFERTLRIVRTRGAIDSAEDVRLPPVGRNLPPRLASHFLQTLTARKPLPAKDPGTAAWPPSTRCTLDLPLLQRAEAIARSHLETIARRDIRNAAFVLIDNQSASVLALGSVSTDAQDSASLNGALTFRNCGSTLKPFLYLAGLERRVLTAATILPDTADAVRDVYPDYDPHNFIHSHAGPVRVREALGSSLNVPAVVALARIGARNVFDSCHAWGLRFDQPLADTGAGFILGTVGVTLLDLTNAYSGLARSGIASPPRLLENTPTLSTRVADTHAVAILNDILCDNQARAPSFGWHSPLATPGRVAVKTGTSAGYRDAWTVGFTSQHTIGVWVGNFDGQPMTRTASITAAAPLWRALLDELFPTDNPLPEPSLPRTTVCSLSGLLPAPASQHTLQELFLPDTAPTQSAADWFTPEGTPLLPAEFAAWCASADNRRAARIADNPSDLRILIPRKDAVYLLDPLLPARQQQVEFRVNQPARTTWKLNGAPLPPDAEGRILWQLAEGDWTLEASNGTTSQTRTFRVTNTQKTPAP